MAGKRQYFDLVGDKDNEECLFRYRMIDMAHGMTNSWWSLNILKIRLLIVFPLCQFCSKELDTSPLLVGLTDRDHVVVVVVIGTLSREAF